MSGPVEAHGIEARFWAILSRTMGRKIPPGRYAVADLPQWDSLRHVELMFEIEMDLGVTVPPAQIAELFSDTDRIVAFLKAHAGAAK